MWCFQVGLLALGASATWLPTQEAVDAAAGRDMRCLHREGKSNAFFYFYDADEEAAAYATPTETEADAVDVTGKVTGFNVDLLEAVADAGGWTVSFHVMCAAGYACAANMTGAPLPDGDVDALAYFQANLTTFDCVVTSTGITLDGILEVGNFVEVPTLKTGFSALALVRAGQESEIPNFKASYLGRFPLVLADFWASDHLLERSRSVDAFYWTRARGTLTLKRR